MSDQPKKQELPAIGGFAKDVPIATILRKREAQLLAALSDNEALRGRVAELEGTVEYWKGYAEEAQATANGLIAESAVSKLRAVSEALEEKLERVDPGRYGKYLYVRDEDFHAFKARLRAIVEGK